MSHRFNTKYFYRFFFSLLFFTTCVALTSFTKNEAFADASTNYIPLAPIGNFVPASGVDTGTSLGTYINSLFKLGIAAAGFLAVIMLVIGGIQYMASEIVSGKEQAKGRINDAVLGLVLAISSYLILNTINPDILNLSRTKVDQVQIDGYIDNTTIATTPVGGGGGPGTGGNGSGHIGTPGGNGSPSNPVIDAGWQGGQNGDAQYVTTYRDGSSQVLYFDSNGNAHLTTFGVGNPPSVISNVDLNANAIQYDSNKNPIRYYNDDGTGGTIGNGGSSPNGGAIVSSGGGKLDESTAQQRLAANGVDFKPGAGFAGINSDTIDQAINIKNSCNCSVVITSGTGGTHASGQYSHANGYKIDIRTNDNEAFINWAYACLEDNGTRGDGSAWWKDEVGNQYAYEREGEPSEHMDVTVTTVGVVNVPNLGAGCPSG